MLAAASEGGSLVAHVRRVVRLMVDFVIRVALLIVVLVVQDV